MLQRMRAKRRCTPKEAGRRQRIAVLPRRAVRDAVARHQLHGEVMQAEADVGVDGVPLASTHRTLPASRSMQPLRTSRAKAV